MIVSHCTFWIIDHYATEHMSYRYDCNTDGLAVLHYWYDDSDCAASPSLTINVTNQTSSCSSSDHESRLYEIRDGVGVIDDGDSSMTSSRCPLSTMEIRWYLEPWNEDHVPSTCTRNESFYFTETRITNQCHELNATHYALWQCFEEQYIGGIYNDSECTNMVDSTHIAYGSCVAGRIQFGFL